LWVAANCISFSHWLALAPVVKMNIYAPNGQGSHSGHAARVLGHDQVKNDLSLKPVVVVGRLRYSLIVGTTVTPAFAVSGRATSVLRRHSAGIGDSAHVVALQAASTSAGDTMLLPLRSLRWNGSARQTAATR
jgi:hypothetical protein